jgi:hypothetical protein
MVVKDEAHSLERSLTSILPAVQEVILVDTGSSDETLQIAGRFSVKVSRFPWRDDFSAARNFSLDLATLPWILVLDADEVFSTVDRIALTTLLKHSEASAYSLTQRNYVESSGKLTWATDDFVEGKTGYVISAKRRTFGNRRIGDLKTVGDLWLLEPDAAALSKVLNHVFGHREEARQVGANAREKVAQCWTWQQSAQKILQRVKPPSKESIKRFQESLDCVVLVEMDSSSEECRPDSVKAMIQSLQRNSYANLKVLLWTREPDPRMEELANEDGRVEVVQQDDLRSLLTWIRHKFQAHFLGVVSEPFIFSRQWLEQIRAVSEQIGSREKVIAPSINLPQAEHYIPYHGSDDDFAFQKFARDIWRSHRGKYQEMSSLPLNCGLVSWNCLTLGAEQSVTSCRDWFRALQQDGVKVYWAKDTYIGNLAALSKVPQPV